MTLAADVSAKRPRSADLTGAGKRTVSRRRFIQFIFGAVLLAAAVLTFYQQLVVRVSRDAVINAFNIPFARVLNGLPWIPGSVCRSN